jgi:hypothetical protein
VTVPVFDKALKERIDKAHRNGNSRVANAFEDIAGILEVIEQVYFKNSRLTLVARAVGYDDGSRDMIVTGDDLGAVIAALEKIKDRSPK